MARYLVLLLPAIALFLNAQAICVGQIGIPRVVIAAGGPYVATDTTLQHFRDKIDLPGHYAKLPLSLVCTNGSMQSLGFNWVRVFLQPGSSDQDLQAGGTESGRLLVDEHTFEGRTQVYLDMTSQLNVGNNRLYIEGAGPAGAVFSWEMRSEGAPVLSRLNPTSTVSGASLRLSGFGFSVRPQENVVKLGIMPITVLQSGFRHLKVAIPPGCAPGTYSLSVAVGGFPSNAIRLTVLSGPEVDGVEYTTVRSGQSMAIYGKNFSAITANNQVYFGQNLAKVTGSTDTTLNVIVPQANPGLASVTVMVSGALAKGSPKVDVIP